MAQLILKEHIERGIQKYSGVRNDKIEYLLKQGNMDAEVYSFADGRILVKYRVSDQALLYTSEDELLSTVILE